MTPYQLKAARALLGWSRLHLVLRSGTSKHMVATLERKGRIAGPDGQMEQGDPTAAIQATLEAAGVEFTSGRAAGLRGCALGVRLRKQCR